MQTNVIVSKKNIRKFGLVGLTWVVVWHLLETISQILICFFSSLNWEK